MSNLDRFRRLSRDEKDRIRQEIVENCKLIADCWIWQGAKSVKGYGLKYIQGQMRIVSRFMLAYSERESLDIDADACHKEFCPYKACCNPAHLFWGTHAENVAQRERERNIHLGLYDVVTPVPLGHETHEAYAVHPQDHRCILYTSDFEPERFKTVAGTA
jgi:hypothetical protein